MNFNNVGEAILMTFDELQNDEKSSEIIDLIDGDNDAEIKRGLMQGIVRLRELGKDDVANQIEEKMWQGLYVF